MMKPALFWEHSATRNAILRDAVAHKQQPHGGNGAGELVNCGDEDEPPIQVSATTTATTTTVAKSAADSHHQGSKSDNNNVVAPSTTTTTTSATGGEPKAADLQQQQKTHVCAAYLAPATCPCDVLAGQIVAHDIVAIDRDDGTTPFKIPTTTAAASAAASSGINNGGASSPSSLRFVVAYQRNPESKPLNMNINDASHHSAEQGKKEAIARIPVLCAETRFYEFLRSGSPTTNVNTGGVSPSSASSANSGNNNKSGGNNKSSHISQHEAGFSNKNGSTHAADNVPAPSSGEPIANVFHSDGYLIAIRPIKQNETLYIDSATLFSDEFEKKAREVQERLFIFTSPEMRHDMSRRGTFKVPCAFTKATVKPVAGMGETLVATHHIVPGEKIFHLSAQEEYLIPFPTMYTICVHAGHQHMLFAHGAQCLAHSCDPNVQLVLDDADGSMDWIACKEIQPGDVVSFNYLTTEHDMQSPFDCNCRSPKCFHRIAGFRNCSALQQKTLSEMASPVIKSLVAAQRRLESSSSSSQLQQPSQHHISGNSNKRGDGGESDNFAADVAAAVDDEAEQKIEKLRAYIPYRACIPLHRGNILLKEVTFDKERNICHNATNYFNVVSAGNNNNNNSDASAVLLSDQGLVIATRDIPVGEEVTIAVV